MTRREIRDSAFKLVFEKLLRDDSFEELYSICDEIDEITVNDAVKELAEGAFEHSDRIDEIISQYSTKRVISRIPKLSLAILRIAFYEILYDDKTPQNAAISEAVLLAQNYTYQNDVNFINGVLGAYAKDNAAAQGDD
ncbi:MAG: transcription antitermination factor NusB [Oscillospiraceae bacterium]|nr:transcription antitermination factor NusB [Oscillospiraceae bacterium]